MHLNRMCDILIGLLSFAWRDLRGLSDKIAQEPLPWYISPHSSRHVTQLSNIENAHLVHLRSWLTAPGCVLLLASITFFNLDIMLSGVLDSKSEEEGGEKIDVWGVQREMW